MVLESSADFGQIYGQALNYGFNALGKYIGNVVSDYLSRKYDLTPIDTYTNSILLAEALEKTLGYGAVLVETRIVKSLCTQLSIPLNGNLKIRMGHPEDIEKYVKEIRPGVRDFGTGIWQ